ncbi:arylformamidase [Mycoemilia scoparia]|uniref:Arylformamidase n=1 Tax=Mycoemilia scoparia TaxID=417184 RepID=A0A9W7ZSK6_9FUNG|nr:arylformamidase [Mycoemilia scoparia]
MTTTAATEGQYPTASSYYKSGGIDVWTLFNQAAAKAKAVNLGQGFMNFESPEFIKKASQKCVADDACNQYSPPRGRPNVLNAIAKRYSRILDRQLDPASEIVVTAGANEAIYAIFCAFLEAGSNDEVILMEPAFDQYTPNIKMAGGKPVYIPLRPVPGSEDASGIVSSKDWTLDMAELEAKISEKTKIIVLNTPHNPIGKVFTKDELEAISNLAKKYNLLVISDEVYENLCFDPQTPHIPIATLPGMWERTLSVYSAGKLFGVTGWRVGWLVGPKELVSPSLTAHTRIVFTTNSPLQEAASIALEEADSNGFVKDQKIVYHKCRSKLMKAFDDVGLPYIQPDGAYFLLVNASKVEIPDDFEFPDEIAVRGKSDMLTYFFTTHIGVSGIPPTEFYSPENAHIAENYIRFAFCKTDDILDEAAKRLQAVKKYVRQQ